MKQEKVEIVLESRKEKPSDTPVKKVKRERPTSARFAFTPRYIPQLTKYVKEVRWDAVERSLKIDIEETPDFEVYEWMDYINRRYKETQSGPFNVNVNDDAIDLKPLGADDGELTTFRFVGISLDKHRCKFSTDDTFSTGFGYLRHQIVLSYQKVERVVVEEPLLPATNELADEEWQTVEA